jgi:hypothetical protein
VKVKAPHLGRSRGGDQNPLDKEFRSRSAPTGAQQPMTVRQVFYALTVQGVIDKTEGRAETYICIGRRDHGPEFCDQPSVRRTLIDEALLGQLTSRYLDLDGARERLGEHQANALPTAQAALMEAERELAAAEARITRVDRGWQDGVLSDAKYKRQSAALEEELAAAVQAVEQARSRVDQINETGTATEAEGGAGSAGRPEGAGQRGRRSGPRRGEPAHRDPPAVLLGAADHA